MTLEVQHDILRIAAEHKEERESNEEVRGVKYHRVERRSGSLYRQIKLPPTADLEHVDARAENGVLTINISKRPEAREERPKTITIA